MLKGKWSFTKKTILWCIVLFIPVLLYAIYLYTYPDDIGMGLSKLVAVLLLMFAGAIALITVCISFLISLLRMADKKSKRGIYSGKKQLLVSASLLIIILVAGFVFWYRTHDPYGKKVEKYYESRTEYNSWQGSVNPMEIQSQPLK